MHRKNLFNLDSAWSLLIMLNIPVIVLGLITVGVLFKNVSRDIVRLNSDTTSYITKISDNFFEQIISTSCTLEASSVYPDVSEFITQKSEYTDSMSYYRLRSTLNSVYRPRTELPLRLAAIYSTLSDTVVTASSAYSVQSFYEIYMAGSGMSYEEVLGTLDAASARVFFISSTSFDTDTGNTVDTLVLCRKIYPYSKNSGFFFAIIDMPEFIQQTKIIAKDSSIKFAIVSDENSVLYQDRDFDSDSIQNKLRNTDGVFTVKGNTFIYHTSSSTNTKYIYEFNGRGLSGNLPQIICIFILLELLTIAFSLFYGGRRATRLDKSFADLSQSNRQLNKYLRENRLYLNRQIISNIISEKDNHSLDELRGKFGIDLCYNSFRVMQFYFTDVFSVLSSCSVEEFCESVCLNLAENRIVCYFTSPTENSCSALINYDDEVLLHSVIFKLFNEALPVQKFNKNMCYIGLGKKTSGLSGVRASYEDALSAVDYCTKNNISITYYDDIKEAAAGIYYPYEIESQLYNSIKNGRTEETAAILDKIREINFISRKPPYFLLQKLTSLMLVVIYRLIDELYADNEEARTKYTRACRNVIRADDPSESYHFLTEIALSISGDFECNSSNQEFKDKIISYIDKNFNNPDLSLAMLATHINISYHHLSHVFTDYMGETFISYLTKYRLEHSKELLTQSDEKIDTIAKKSGFSGSNTFIKIFKKYYGITPGRYRSENNS